MGVDVIYYMMAIAQNNTNLFLVAELIRYSSTKLQQPNLDLYYLKMRDLLYFVSTQSQRQICRIWWCDFNLFNVILWSKI